MERFKGLKLDPNDSIYQRAAQALIFLLRKEGERGFASWTELYCIATGTSPDKANPEDVKQRLRKGGGKVWAILREQYGLGFCRSLSDGSMVRATARDSDSIRNYWPILDQRENRAVENSMNGKIKTAGPIDKIRKTKDNAFFLAQAEARLKKTRALYEALGMARKEPATEAA